MLRYCAVIISVFIFIFIVGNSRAGADDGMAPWSFNQSTLKKDHVQEAEGRRILSPPARLLRSGVRFFREHISSVDGDRCQMYPTCSSYSIQAIESHGFFIGYLMTVDRLIHESNEMDRAILIQKGDRFYYYDPIENNDFWWKDRESH
jgi:hypothetical protein